MKASKGVEAVQEITSLNIQRVEGRQNPISIIFALALCARDQDPDTKKAAYDALNKICRIPTHLFAFVTFCEGLSIGTGWGRAHRRAIQNWYLERSPKSLVTKYQQCDGWSHRDLLCLSHLKTDSVRTGCVLKYMYIIKALEADYMPVTVRLRIFVFS